MKITSQEQWKQLGIERAARIRPLIHGLAKEAQRWAGTTGPIGIADYLRKIEHTTKFNGFRIRVIFEYDRPAPPPPLDFIHVDEPTR